MRANIAQPCRFAVETEFVVVNLRFLDAQNSQYYFNTNNISVSTYGIYDLMSQKRISCHLCC